MYSYIIRRLLQAIPVLIGSTTIVFILIYLAPGDVVETMMGQRSSVEAKQQFRHELGLDQPTYIQYFNYMRKALVGDFGRSWVTGRKVRDSILMSFPYTVELAIAAMLITILIGISVGLISSVWRGSFWDHASRIFALFFISNPIFVFALLLIIVFAVKLSWLPPSGVGEGMGSIIYLILPAIALGSRSAAFIARVTRASMLEVLGKIYVTTAYAKGLKKSIVILKHALKNALIPVVTIIGLNFGDLLTGAIITEYIFGRPGLGKLTIDSISQRDLPVLMGVIVFITIVFILANLAVDIFYSFIDPRIKYG
jgi:peptide/nickel transport system permease protein